jgi:hypothetical protein
MLAAPCTTVPPMGKALAAGCAQANPTKTCDNTKAPMKTPDEAKTEATKAAPPNEYSPEDLPWLQACSPTAIRQPNRSEKTVLKQFAFIGRKPEKLHAMITNPCHCIGAGK